MARRQPAGAVTAKDGTQVLRRAAAVLRIVGRSHAEGVRLSDIAEALHLSRSTAHRILKCLADEGLVHHRSEGGRYVVGRLAYELGLAVTSDVLGIAQWHAAVDRVAQRTGLTTYLISRSGMEATCVFKTDGNTAIRVIPVEVGQRRLLGVGAGATALLAALDRETSEQIIAAIAPHLSDYPHLSATTIRGIVAETRRTGFSVSRGNVVDGAIGLAMTIPCDTGEPTLALSIAALGAQASEATVEEWKRVLKEEIARALKAAETAAG